MNKKELRESMRQLALYRWSKTSKKKRAEHGRLMRAKKAEKARKNEAD